MTTDAVGGVWTYALELARALADAGVHITLAVLGPEPNAVQCAQAATIPGVDLRMTRLKLEWLAQDAQQVLAAGHDLGILARDVGADLVHLNSPALAAGDAFAMPVVSVCHSCVRTWWRCVGTGPMPSAFAWQSDLVAAGYAAAQTLVAPTRAFAALTADCYNLERPPLVVHNGRQQAAAAPATAIADFIITAGRLWDAAKNVAALDRMAALSPWPIMAAGPLAGPNGARLDLLHVRALGLLDENELAAHLSARPVFASLALYEPFGLAVLEAAQAGCALVLSDQPGFRELWQDAAVFVPANDDAAGLAAIGRIMQDRGYRTDLGNRAARRAGRYTVAAMAKSMMDIYRSCLNQPGRVEAAA